MCYSIVLEQLDVAHSIVDGFDALIRDKRYLTESSSLPVPQNLERKIIELFEALPASIEMGDFTPFKIDNEGFRQLLKNMY